jgi:hypothetical protein
VANLGETAFPLVIVRYVHNDTLSREVHAVNFKTNEVRSRLLRLWLAMTLKEKSLALDMNLRFRDNPLMSTFVDSHPFNVIPSEVEGSRFTPGISLASGKRDSSSPFHFAQGFLGMTLREIVLNQSHQQSRS